MFCMKLYEHMQNLHDEVDALVKTCLIYEDWLLKMIIE